MSKKHFQAIADALKSQKPMEDDAPELMALWRAMVKTMADTMRQFNSNFDRARFERAAGLD